MDRYDYRYKYLKSEKWQAFREETLFHRPNCQHCGLHDHCSLFFYGQRLDIHHLTYKNLGAEKPEDVEVLCRACHEIAESKKTPPKGQFTGYPGLVEFECPKCYESTGVILFHGPGKTLPYPKFWTRCACTRDEYVENSDDEELIDGYSDEDATEYIRDNFNSIMEWRKNYGDLKR